MSALEDRIAGLFGYSFAVLFGAARSGLVALLEDAGARARRVVTPSNLCPAVAAAVHAAGGGLRLAPVSSRSGLADDEAMVAAMHPLDAAGVVMPCHLYGARLEYPKLRAAARQHGWLIIENDTLFSAVADGNRRIAFGDAVVVSFGNAKTVEAGVGGAVLTDDAALAHRLAKTARTWPDYDERARATERSMTLARRHLRELGRIDLAEDLLGQDAANCRHGLPHAARGAIERALDGWTDVVAARRERARLWDHALAGLESQLPALNAPIFAPWRLVRRVEPPLRRADLVAALRGASVDVGTNFPPLSDAYPRALANQAHPESQRWGSTVINLWLSDDYDAAKIHRAAAIIHSCVAAGRAEPYAAA
jgi:dTDP-4-amino-4,6-dideoxygalactose transaminase